MSGLGTKEIDLNRYLKMQEIGIAVITESKKKLRGTKDLEECIMFFLKKYHIINEHAVE